MNKAAFLTRNNSYNQLQAIEAYRSSVLTQALNEPTASNGITEAGGIYGINQKSRTGDSVELSEESIRLARFDSSNAAQNPKINKEVRLEKAASISDEKSDANGRNVSSPGVSKTGTMGPPVNTQDVYTARTGESKNNPGIPGSTVNNQNKGVYDVTNQSAAEEPLKNNVTNIGIPSNSVGNTATTQNAVNHNTELTANRAATVPPQAPLSLEKPEGPDRKEQPLKKEDVNKTSTLERVQSNEATRTADLSKELSENEAVRTREFLKDRYREPGIAVYVEPNNLTQAKNYMEPTLLQNVGSQIAQASRPANRISVYA